MLATEQPAAGAQKPDIGSTQPLGILAQELADAALPAIDLAELPTLDGSQAPDVSVSDVQAAAEEAPAPEARASNLTEFGELALLATGEWQAMQRSDVKPETKTDTAATGEINGPETLSLISKPALAPKADSADPTLQLALLPEAEVGPKRAVNGQ